jgi:hypothetical protein
MVFLFEPEEKMKKSLAVKSLVLAALVALLLFSFGAFAESLKVEDGQRAYVTKIVTAEHVKGVELRLSKEIIRNDCNARTMSLTHSRVSGDGDGWYDKYFFDAQMTQTKMFCPLDKPVKETIYSQPVFIKAFTNENVTRKVVVSIVIPNGYKLEVLEVQ